MALLTVTAAVAACSQGHSEVTVKSDDDDPARVAAVEGTSLKSVTLSAHAADRLGIKTEPVREAASPGVTAPAIAVPLAALIYDKNGDAWVYVASKPRTFVRERVTIARVDGSLAILEAGPAVGTQVVTVGAAELLGAEYGVGGQ